MFHTILESELKKRQKNILELLPQDEALLILANQSFYKNSDTDFRFRQDSNFWYFTGFDEDSSCVLFVDGKIILFAKPKNPDQEVWTGVIAGLEKAKEMVGADEVYPFEKLTEIVEAKTKNLKKVYFDTHGNSFILLRKNLQSVFEKAGIETQKEMEITSSLRQIKSDWEVDQIQKACDISVLAHQRVGEFLADFNKPNTRDLRFPFDKNLQQLSENNLQAILNYTFNQFQSIEAYPSIVASGKNATTLHYWQNNSVINNNDLVLIDSACEFNYYSSDITRCYSLAGFSGPQKDIYDLVLKANIEVIEIAKTHVGGNLALQDLKVKSIQILTQGLIDLKILSGSLEYNIEAENYKKYYMHSISHWLGLDTHDQGGYKDKDGNPLVLVPGMVFTVEPGLYFKKDDLEVAKEFRGIGVRIEDDVLITSTGINNLTQKLAK